jgi:hypothetical protein
MGKNDRIRVPARVGWQTVAAIIAAQSLQACVSGLHVADRDYVEDSPILIRDDRAVTIARREMDRYRCASGAILQCSGPSDAIATCICSSMPAPP